MEKIEVFPANSFDGLKEKRERAITTKSNELYKFHTMFAETVNKISSSVLLASNDVIVDVYTEEVAEFVAKLQRFRKEIAKANSVQELNQYYKQKCFSLKDKEMLDGLIADLKEWSVRDGYEVDIKSIVELYNATMKEAEEELIEKFG